MKTKTTLCDQCDCCTVNGVVCHELGCPDSWADEKRSCDWCGCYFKPDNKEQTFCDEDCAKAYTGGEY